MYYVKEESRVGLILLTIDQNINNIPRTICIISNSIHVFVKYVQQLTKL